MGAAAKGHLEALDVLLELGADPDVVTSYTVAHVAVSNQNGELLDRLLQVGIDCSLVDSYGNTPLAALLFRKGATLPRLQRMVELGANPHRKNRAGVSPIESARDFELSEFVALFETVPLPDDIDSLAFQEKERSQVLENADGSENWKELSAKLWDELVPPRHAAPTVQGELLRCIGSLTDEAYRNGNINWGSHHIEMVNLLENYLLDGSLDSQQEADLRPAIRALKHYRNPDLSGDGSPHYLVSEAVVNWCLANRQLIPTHQQ